MLNIEEIKQRCESATKGPWSVEQLGKNLYPQRVVSIGNPVLVCETYTDPNYPPENAEFIAHSREDLPACVAEIERLRDLNRRALAIISDAIMHGMPITPEVAAVRNAIVCGDENPSGKAVDGAEDRDV